MYDSEAVKAMDSDLNTHLIFVSNRGLFYIEVVGLIGIQAGLFSAVNTAFCVESYPDLKPNDAESDGTNALLRAIVQSLNNSAVVALPPPDFAVPHSAVVANCLFFTSLCCFTFSAVGGVLAKQWLNEYERAGTHRSPYARARFRHAKYIGMHKYYCELIIQALGTILQLALIIFLGALAYWLWYINTSVAVVVIAGGIATVVFYIATTTISIYDYTSPFSTRLSSTLRSLFRPPSPLSPAASSRLDAQCIAWMRDNFTVVESVIVTAKAAAFLPFEAQYHFGLDLTVVGPLLLRSLLTTNVIPRSYAQGTLLPIVEMLREALGTWRGVPLDLACTMAAQLHEVLRITVHNEHTLCDVTAQLLEPFSSQVTQDSIESARPPTKELFVAMLKVPSLSARGKRSVISLWWNYFKLSEGRVAREWAQEHVRDALVRSPLDSWPVNMTCELATTVGSRAAFDGDINRLEARIWWSDTFGAPYHWLRSTRPFKVGICNALWQQHFSTEDFENYAEFWLNRTGREPPEDFGALIVTLLLGRWRSCGRKCRDGRCTHISEGKCISAWFMDNNFIERAVDFLTGPRGLRYQSVAMIPLYWWYHLRMEHLLDERPRWLSIPYLQVIFTALFEEFYDRGRNIPDEDVTWAVACIRAFVDEIQKVQSPTDPPEMYNKFLHADTNNQEYTTEYVLDILAEVKSGTYAWPGPDNLGQQLWDCLKLVAQTLRIPSDAVLAAWKADRGPLDFHLDWAEQHVMRARPTVSQGELPPFDEAWNWRGYSDLCIEAPN